MSDLIQQTQYKTYGNLTRFRYSTGIDESKGFVITLDDIEVLITEYSVDTDTNEIVFNTEPTGFIIIRGISFSTEFTGDENSAENIKLDTSNFDNNLDSSIEDVQDLAEAVDDLVLDSGSSQNIIIKIKAFSNLTKGQALSKTANNDISDDFIYVDSITNSGLNILLSTEFFMGFANEDILAGEIGEMIINGVMSNYTYTWPAGGSWIKPLYLLSNGTTTTEITSSTAALKIGILSRNDNTNDLDYTYFHINIPKSSREIYVDSTLFSGNLDLTDNTIFRALRTIDSIDLSVGNLDGVTAVNSTVVGLNGNIGSTADYITCIGYSVMPNAYGDRNFGGGYRAGYSLTSGLENVFVGANSAYSATSSDFNVIIGENCAFNMTTADRNTIGGNNGASSLTAGGFNTGWGYNCLTGISTEFYNSAFGYNSGPGANNRNTTCLGSNSTVTGDNQVQLGDSSVLGVYTYGGLFNRANGTKDIGDTTNYWKDLYLKDNLKMKNSLGNQVVFTADNITRKSDGTYIPEVRYVANTVTTAVGNYKLIDDSICFVDIDINLSDLDNTDTSGIYISLPFATVTDGFVFGNIDFANSTLLNFTAADNINFSTSGNTLYLKSSDGSTYNYTKCNTSGTIRITLQYKIN